jgi:pyrimidine-nucleoside phosphorylase
MVEIGTRAGRKTTAVITDMDQPLGMAVGNALEVREAVEILQDRQKSPLREVSLYLAAHITTMNNIQVDI